MYRTLILIMAFVASGLNLASAQSLGKRVKRANDFNNLLGDYYTLDPITQKVSKVDPDLPPFDVFYKTLKAHWDNDNKADFDTIPGFKLDNSRVIVLKVFLNQDGTIYYDTSSNHTEYNQLYHAKENSLSPFYRRKRVKAAQHRLEPNSSSSSSGWKRSTYQQQLDKFYQTNQLTGVERFSDSLRRLASKMDRTFVFVHGYNVPHSLAHLQGNKVAWTLAEEYPNETILFVRVYWDGKSRKKLLIKKQPFTEGYVVSKFIFKDELSISNATNWFATRCDAQKCGITLREILYKADVSNSLTLPPREINVIGHSLGALVTVTALINSIEGLDVTSDSLKMHLQNANYQIENVDTAWVHKYVQSKGDRKAKHVSFMLDQMVMEHLPSYRVNVFLNAPAISGTPYFKYLDTTKSYSFHSGFNRYDPVLAKRFILKNNARISFKASMLGSTTLGINFLDENNEVRSLHPDSFRASESSDLVAHDFFKYTSHPKYNVAFNSFLKEVK